MKKAVENFLKGKTRIQGRIVLGGIVVMFALVAMCYGIKSYSDSQTVSANSTVQEAPIIGISEKLSIIEFCKYMEIAPAMKDKEIHGDMTFEESDFGFGPSFALYTTMADGKRDFISVKKAVRDSNKVYAITKSRKLIEVAVVGQKFFTREVIDNIDCQSIDEDRRIPVEDGTLVISYDGKSIQKFSYQHEGIMVKSEEILKKEDMACKVDDKSLWFQSGSKLIKVSFANQQSSVVTEKINKNQSACFGENFVYWVQGTNLMALPLYNSEGTRAKVIKTKVPKIVDFHGDNGIYFEEPNGSVSMVVNNAQ